MEKCSEPKFRAAVQNQGVEPGSGLRSAVNLGIYTTGLGKDKKATTERIAVRVMARPKFPSVVKKITPTQGVSNVTAIIFIGKGIT